MNTYEKKPERPLMQWEKERLTVPEYLASLQQAKRAERRRLARRIQAEATIEAGGVLFAYKTYNGG